MIINIGVSPSCGKQNRINQNAVAACCICTWPVVNTARNFVILLNLTRTKLKINAINNRNITCEKLRPIPSIADCTAFCPKYGSITIASKLKRSFNPTRIGLKLLTSPPEPTLKIKKPTVALIKPASESYQVFF